MYDNISIIKSRDSAHTRNESKGWGKEVKICNFEGDEASLANTRGYSGKLLVYNKIGSKSSMHFHFVKHETFYVLKGKFTLRYYDGKYADLKEAELAVGDTVIIPPNHPHQLICKTKGGTIIEFASHDRNADNFRIAKGDSQIK